MNKTYPRILLSLLLLCLGAGGVWAEESTTPPAEPVGTDEVLLTNGSKIIGLVTGARDGAIKIDTDFAGSLEIPMEMVASLRTEDPVIIQMADQSVIENQPLVISESQLVVADAAGVEQSRAVEDLLVVNPEPWELGRGYKWSGLVSFAIAIERGNSDTDELDYNLDTNWRSDDDRYTLKAYGEIDEANDVEIADNWTIQGKYDNFFSDVSYWGLQAFAESDDFADLDLRYLVGPYVGRDFFTDPIFTLAAEVGASYVNEDFIVAPDQEYPGANWNLQITSDYLGGDSRLYFNQLGILNLDHTEDLIVNSTFGLGFPLLFGFEAAAEILLEYDSGAVEGVEKLDETYSFRIGYTW